MDSIKRALGTPAFQIDAGKPLVGYAAVWNAPATITERGRTFQESVQRGAFLKSLAGGDVIATFNHDESKLLGRTASGTLRLVEDIYGLRFEIDLPDTPTGAEVRGLVGRGDLNGASFVAGVRGDVWRGSIRTLTELDLVELGPVTLPAYKSTRLQIGRSLSFYLRKLRARS